MADRRRRPRASAAANGRRVRRSPGGSRRKTKAGTKSRATEPQEAAAESAPGGCGWTERTVRVQRHSVCDEMASILQRARARVTTVVGIDSLVLFATVTGDAWLLDYDDELALCAMRDGKRQPMRVMESATRYMIDWTHDYVIDGETMVFVARTTGEVRVVAGYPTSQIVAVIAKMRQARG